jgi:hypothetical protein
VTTDACPEAVVVKELVVHQRGGRAGWKSGEDLEHKEKVNRALQDLADETGRGLVRRSGSVSSKRWGRKGKKLVGDGGEDFPGRSLTMLALCVKGPKPGAEFFNGHQLAVWQAGAHD